jgi:hypothetical protein
MSESLIDKKKNELTGITSNAENIEQDPNATTEQPIKKLDWKGFFKNLFHNFILIIIWGFIGGNMVYLMNAKSDQLSEWFPTDPNKFPYKDVFPNKASFPYTLTGNYSKMFGESARDSYIYNRDTIKKMLSFFKQKKADDYVFCFGIFIVIICILSSSPIGFFTSIIGEFKSAKYEAFVLLFIFGISLLWPILISYTQFFQIIYILLLYPIFTNYYSIKEIVASKLYYMKIAFGFLTILSASKYLDSISAISMAFVLFVSRNNI